MKKSITMYAILSAILFMANCTKETTTKETGTPAATLPKSSIDYEIDYKVNVNYSVMVVAGNNYSIGMGKASTNLEGATVTITQGNKTIQVKTGPQGIAAFSGVYKGVIAVTVQKDDYTTVKYLVTANGSVAETNGSQIDIANIIPIFKIANDPSTSILKGKITVQSDLTNEKREVAPQNTRITAAIDADDSIFKGNYIAVKNAGLLANLNSGKIIQFSYESLFYDSTDANGEYEIIIPGGIAGLPFKISASDIVANQTVYENSGVSGFNRAIAYRTIFSAEQTPSPVPLAGGAEVIFLTGSGANAIANISGNGQIDRINIINGGTGYVGAPKVTITGGGGNGATATATIANGVITGINITNAGNGYTSEPTVILNSGSGGAISATVGGTGNVVSINVVNTGSGYTVTPNVSISAPGGTGVAATASANVSGGRITSIVITNQGSGYSSAPSVTIDVPGTGGTTATATAIFSGLSVQNVTITNPGFGYVAAPSITFSEPNLPSGVKATASAQIDPNTGTITGITITNAGSGYLSTPSITVSSGSGASAQAVFSGRSITGFTVLSQGSNYTAAPKVKITGGGGSGAQATALVANGRVTGVTIINGGNGYTSSPSIELIAGSGAQASIVVSNGQISAINIVNGGSQYTGAPTIQINPLPFSGPGGGATATATIDGTGAVTGITITNQGTGYIGGNVPSVAEPFSIDPSLTNSKLYVKPALTYIRDIHYGTGKKLPQ